MSKVTDKLQVTLPKALADRYGIRPGDEVEWQAAGEVVILRPPANRRPAGSVEERLRIFDEGTRRQREREAEVRAQLGEIEQPKDRGWTREDLYRRGGAD